MKLRELYRSLVLCATVFCAASGFVGGTIDPEADYRATFEYQLDRIFNRNDNGMFEEKNEDTVVVKRPEAPIDVNGRFAFFYESAPPFKYFSCINYTAMNNDKNVEICETMISLRCVLNIKGIKEFRKNIVFPDGRQSYYIDVMCGLGMRCCEAGCCPNQPMDWVNFAYKILLLLFPFCGMIGIAWWWGRDKRPKPRPLPPQAERLRRYREDLEELLHCVYEGRR